MPVRKTTTAGLRTQSFRNRFTGGADKLREALLSGDPERIRKATSVARGEKERLQTFGPSGDLTPETQRATADIDSALQGRNLRTRAFGGTSVPQREPLDQRANADALANRQFGVNEALAALQGTPLRS
jgi:hypothetical protein